MSSLPASPAARPNPALSLSTPTSTSISISNRRVWLTALSILVPILILAYTHTYTHASQLAPSDLAHAFSRSASRLASSLASFAGATSPSASSVSSLSLPLAPRTSPPTPPTSHAQRSTPTPRKPPTMAIESALLPPPSTHTTLPASLKQALRDQLQSSVTTTTTSPIPTQHRKMSAEEKAARRAKFEGVFVKIREELVGHMRGEGMPEEAVVWFEDNLNYNVPGGKLNRGLSVVDTLRILRGRELTEEEYHRAAVLGWGIELLQAFFLVSDDMMDASITRRGQPCWYRQPKVGMLAINDSFLLEGAIYWLLKKYFRAEPYYADLLDVFHETTYQTEYGQLVDLITAPEDKVDLGKFSLGRHRLIVIYKTAFYSFYLPVACAMLVAGIPYPTETPPRFTLDKGVVTSAEDPYSVALGILIPLGEYFQVQDDFLDFSAPPEVLGKIGTDIVDNKCSWVVNTALNLTSPSSPFPSPFAPSLSKARLSEIRSILDDNYGRKDAEKEAKVKQVYEELGIRKEYEKYEEGVVEDVRRRIGEVDEASTGLRREVFESFLGKIYRRSK